MARGVGKNIVQNKVWAGRWAKRSCWLHLKFAQKFRRLKDWCWIVYNISILTKPIVTQLANWRREIEVLHGWTRVKKRGPSCEMPSVARRLVVRQSWHGAWYKRVYMWFLIIRRSRDVWIWWSQPTLQLSVWCMCSNFSVTRLFFFKFLRLTPVLGRYCLVCCGHRVGVLLVVGVGGG